MNKFATIGLPINAGLQSTPNDFVPVFEYGIAGREMYDYYWIYVCGCVFAFAMAFGIGANDVANSFATSVGSGTLKMWQTIIIAGLCEFFGAYLLGARVTATIKSGIVNINTFVGHDDLFMFGMLCALICVSVWLMAATMWELPGSYSGFVRWAILRRGDLAYGRVFLFFPILIFVTFTINLLFILDKGGIGKGQGFAQGVKLSQAEMASIALGVGGGCAVLTVFILNPLMRRSIDGMSEQKLAERYAQVTGIKTELPVPDVEAGPTPTVTTVVGAETATTAARTEPEDDDVDKLENGPTTSNDRDKTAVVETQRRGEPPATPNPAELAFGFLQVFTACFASFAHGANDVANAIGPLAGIVQIYNRGVGGATSKSEVPDWILVLGGTGLVVGLAVYGHIIIAAMGVKMVKITPSRGFSAELSTALVIVLGSYLSLPLSSTQVAVGSIVGVGLVEGRAKKSVNWKLLARVFTGGS
ncbi:hypothetical protein BASA81_007142 [Batrachochytrium salamandrivorans]|nr:hypothetical protein BASA81_007142 [Batrachochytrium salamandrivorans]